MGRTIQPFSTQHDGDVLYAVTTNEIDNPNLSPLNLAMAASELAWDAVLNSVPELPELPEILESGVPLELLKSYEGTYHFFGGGKLVVSIKNEELACEFFGNGRIYFDNKRNYQLKPSKDGLFIIAALAQDIIRFDSSKGIVTGLTINPGPWSVRAERK